MIHTHDDAGNRLGITWDGMTLNNPADPEDDIYELNGVGVMGQFDQTLDSDPSEDGTEIGPVKRSMLILRTDWTIRAPSIAKLADKVLDFAFAFDPARLAYENPTTYGVLAMGFSVPTTDTTNYATGFVPSYYYARPRTMPMPPISSYTGTSCFCSVEMIVPKARRFYQTESSVTGSGTATNTLAGVWSWPTVTITMTGAGSATYSIARAHATYGTDTLTLNLSGLVNGNVVTVDMGTKTVKVGGVITESLVVAGSEFFKIDVGANTLTVTNPTNATTVTTWRRAWNV